MKKAVSLIILVSMMLHSASRLGILSHIYEERHSIAFTIGLIAEIPIALCSSDYDVDPALSVQTTGDQDPIPRAFQAREIVLFCDDPVISLDFIPVPLNNSVYRPYLETPYGSPVTGVFQPPRA